MSTSNALLLDLDREQPRIPTGTVELTGIVRCIVWSNWDSEEVREQGGNGRVIARLADTAEAAGVPVKGPCPEHGLQPGTSYRFLGRWTESEKYGREFNFSTFADAQPCSRTALTRYLAKLCPGVGDVKAERLWTFFGPEAAATIRTRPDRVAASGILTAEQAAAASAELTKHAALEQTRIDLFGLFDRRGFPGKAIEAAIARWGARAGTHLRRNPFALITARPKLPGAGFRRCDKLYIDLGLPAAALKRQMLCGWNALREDGTGHTWQHFPSFRDAIASAIGGTSSAKIDPQRALTLGRRARWLARHVDADGMEWVSEAGQAKSERDLAAKINALRLATPLWADAHADIPIGLGGVSEHQSDVLQVALREAVAILAGCPGTGKTFSAAQIIKYLACRFGLSSIAVCAPTGKAAVRITAAMLSYAIDLPATTIHRLLEINRNGHDGDGWGFGRNAGNPLAQRFVIVDEMSMCDTDLACCLLDACAPGTHILLVGDPYQLPPVGHGAPLRDLIAAGAACGELTEIQRNSGMIVKACHQMKDGKNFETAPKFDPTTGENLRHIETVDDAQQVEVLQAILKHFGDAKLFDPIWDCQVLVAVNGKSLVSRSALNKVLQGLLNPTGKQVAGNPFRVGDKIICLKNNGFRLATFDHGRPSPGPIDDPGSYHDVLDDVGAAAEVFVANGDLGRVLAVGPKVMIARLTMPDRTIRVAVGKVKAAATGDGEDAAGGDGASEDGKDGGKDGNRSSSGSNSGCDFDLAYAITTHKSQGSEWPCVLVMIDESGGAKRICSREHVYTSISRAKGLCVLIGKMAVLRGHCRRVSLTRRKTFLVELLKEGWF